MQDGAGEIGPDAQGAGCGRQSGNQRIEPSGHGVSSRFQEDHDVARTGPRPGVEGLGQRYSLACPNHADVSLQGGEKSLGFLAGGLGGGEHNLVVVPDVVDGFHDRLEAGEDHIHIVEHGHHERHQRHAANIPRFPRGPCPLRRLLCRAGGMGTIRGFRVAGRHLNTPIRSCYCRGHARRVPGQAGSVFGLQPTKRAPDYFGRW